MARPQAIRYDIGAYESSRLAAVSIVARQNEPRRAFQCHATASSGLPVILTASGDCTVNAAMVTLTGQADDHMYNPAADVAQSFTVNGTQATGFNLFLPVIMR